MSEIFVRESESLDSALRRFSKLVQNDGILADAREHEFYLKPSDRRKKEEASRRRKLRKAEARKLLRRDY